MTANKTNRVQGGQPPPLQRSQSRSAERQSVTFDDDENYVTMDAGHLSDNFLSDAEDGEVTNEMSTDQLQDLGSDSQGSIRSTSQVREKRFSSTEERSTDVNSDSSSEESSRETTPELNVSAGTKGKRVQK